MKLRTTVVGVATAGLLVVGLPALGQAVGIYSARLDAVGQVYATVSGACGHVDVPGSTLAAHYTFCFGDAVEARQSDRSQTSASIATFVMEERGDCGEDGCARWFPEPSQVTYKVDPLLETASVKVVLEGCGVVDVTLTASAEPDLRRSGPAPNYYIAGDGDQGQAELGGAGSGSIGRDASVAGTVCDAPAVTTDLPLARIIRGLGSEGFHLKLSYA